MFFPSVASLLVATLSVTSAALGSKPAKRGCSAKAAFATAQINPAHGYDVDGLITFANVGDGKGVHVAVAINGLDTLLGRSKTPQFMYHIHHNPIPENGNCSAAGGHFDPYKVGDVVVCNPKSPGSTRKTCYEGNLSGKHGKLPGEASHISTYVDSELAFAPEARSLAGRSVVIHMPNVTRVACGNIVVH